MRARSLRDGDGRLALIVRPNGVLLGVRLVGRAQDGAAPRENVAHGLPVERVDPVLDQAGEAVLDVEAEPGEPRVRVPRGRIGTLCVSVTLTFNLIACF